MLGIGLNLCGNGKLNMIKIPTFPWCGKSRNLFPHYDGYDIEFHGSSEILLNFHMSYANNEELNIWILLDLWKNSGNNIYCRESP